MSDIKALSKKELAAKLARKTTWIHDQMRDNPDFPKARYMNNRPYWLEHEVDQWLFTLPTERQGISLPDRLAQRQ